NDGVLATMKLLVDAGADINARSITEPRGGRGGAPAEASQAAQYALSSRRGSQMPSAQAVPHETALHSRRPVSAHRRRGGLAPPRGGRAGAHRGNYAAALFPVPECVSLGGRLR